MLNSRRMVSVSWLWIAISIYYQVNGQLSVTELMIIVGAFFLSIQLKRHDNAQAILFGSGLLIFLNRLWPLDSTTGLVLSALSVISYSTHKSWGRIWKKIMRSYKVRRFVISKKYQAIYMNEYGENIYLRKKFEKGEAVVGSSDIAGYRGKEVLILNKKYFEYRWKIVPSDTYILDEKKFEKVVNTFPQTKDDVIVEMI